MSPKRIVRVQDLRAKIEGWAARLKTEDICTTSFYIDKIVGEMEQEAREIREAGW